VLTEGSLTSLIVAWARTLPSGLDAEYVSPGTAEITYAGQRFIIDVREEVIHVNG
jgi:hypothetical protein